MRLGIRGKLMAGYGLVILVSIAVVGLGVRWLWARHVVELAHEAMMGGASAAHLTAALDQALGGAALAALGIAILLSWLLSHVITAPLHEMTAVARRLAAGDYGQRVTTPRSRDEVGELAAVFNEMASSLARTEQMRRELVANVAHELRTPLTSIEGYMEALEDGVFPATTETFDRVRREAARLRRLVDDLTELSRVEAPEEWPRTPVQLDRLILDTIATMAPNFQAKGVALEAALPTDGAVVLGDADRLRQVLVNLLDNALCYTPSGGRVDVSLVIEGAAARLTVRDTGCGIAPEDLPHIFERFYRGDKSRTRATGGAGIGLTIARHIVQHHGGTITVSSQPGAWSTFEVILPTNS
jgi:histidine kinase